MVRRTALGEVEIFLQCGWCGHGEEHVCGDLTRYVKEGSVKFDELEETKETEEA